MLLLISLLLLIGWLLGMLGAYMIGDIVHVLLAIGLVLFLKARKDAARRLGDR
ncbi:MAG: DUF5670 family protein [Vicinamibacterales bacterium]